MESGVERPEAQRQGIPLLDPEAPGLLRYETWKKKTMQSDPSAVPTYAQATVQLRSRARG